MTIKKFDYSKSTEDIFYKIIYPIYAKEFLYGNSNMKNLTKKDVYVKIDTSNVAEVAKLLDSAGEELYNKQSCLSGETEDYCSIILSDNGEWTRTNNPDEKTEVTLDQLAEILGVKQQFKVGDRVRCINSVDIIYRGGAWKEGYEFIVGEVRDTSSGICIFPDGINSGVYAKFLELVKDEVKVETVTISRANLGRLYPIVCEGWQLYITSLLDDVGSFANEVQVPLEKLRQAYKEADNIQKATLIEVAPLPKVKSTVKVSRWVNVYDETNSSYKSSNGIPSNTYDTKEDAIRNKSYSGYLSSIELTGEYTTEVEDPLMINEDEIPF